LGTSIIALEICAQNLRLVAFRTLVKLSWVAILAVIITRYTYSSNNSLPLRTVDFIAFKVIGT